MDIKLHDDIKYIILEYLQEYTKTQFQNTVLTELKTNTKYFENRLINSGIKILDFAEPEPIDIVSFEMVKQLCSGDPIYL